MNYFYLCSQRTEVYNCNVGLQGPGEILLTSWYWITQISVRGPKKKNPLFKTILKIKFQVLIDIFWKDFLSPGHDRVVTIKSRDFSIAKVWRCMGLYWSTRGCDLAGHSSIHTYSYWEEGWQDSNCLRAS